MSEISEVYTFGQNNYGELALGHTEEKWVPQLVQSCYNMKVGGIAAGNEVTLILLENGSLYLSGFID